MKILLIFFVLAFLPVTAMAHGGRETAASLFMNSAPPGTSVRQVWDFSQWAMSSSGGGMYSSIANLEFDVRNYHACERSMDFNPQLWQEAKAEAAGDRACMKRFASKTHITAHVKAQFKACLAAVPKFKSPCDGLKNAIAASKTADGVVLRHEWVIYDNETGR